MQRDQRPMQNPMQQRPYNGNDGPNSGGRYPGAGYGNQHPLRPIPSHLQRPPFEQPFPNQPKAPNPLDDLVDTEKEYVADLKVLLQRVSAGWTQDDFPPKEVDVLLRNIEDIYSVNRKFSKKLVDVKSSADPTKELGSVLMWFVDSMETAYSNYCRNHVPHFDNWPEIINNTRLQDILGEIAAEQVQHVTLDSFLMKPIDRLHYYRRLYMRLLDSSERGKPDFDALEAAFMRIDTILRFVTVDVPGTSRHPASPALSGISSMSAMRQALPSPPITTEQTSPGFPPHHGGGGNNYNGSPALPPSPMSPGMNPAHRPQQQQQGNTLRTAEAMMELERSLDTSRVLDLFTMQPKACSLSLALIERDVLIRGDFAFAISTDNGDEERFNDGYIILLTDLLLICRIKTQEEIDDLAEGEESMFWLLFPPLAIRHVSAKDCSVDEDEPMVELTIVNRVKARIWTMEDQIKFDWIEEVNNAQQQDSNKVAQQQQQQQQNQQGQQNQQQQQLNRNHTQNRPMRPMGPGSPLSPTFQGGPHNNGPMSPSFQGGPMSPHPRPPMLAMGGGGGGPMSGMPSPGFRPQMSPNGGMGRPMMHPGGGGGRPPQNPNYRMSMRRDNTVMSRPPGGPRGRAAGMGDVATAKEVIMKTKPCDVFQWRDDIWDPLVEDDDCYVELRLTTANRLAMAVTTFESGQLVLNAWIVESTSFRRASETDVSVSMDMGASVQWFLVALNSGREAEEFCHAFQRTKDRAMYDPSLQKSASPILSRGQSLASTAVQKTQVRKEVVKQTLTGMYPPAECKLLLQAGDHGQWMSLGASRVEIRMEKPSGYVRLFVGLVSSQKRILDSVIVQQDCLELVGPKKLAITLQNPQEKMSIIYMLQFKDEVIANKIFDGLSLNVNE